MANPSATPPINSSTQSAATAGPPPIGSSAQSTVPTSIPSSVIQTSTTATAAMSSYNSDTPISQPCASYVFNIRLRNLTARIVEEYVESLPMTLFERAIYSNEKDERYATYRKFMEAQKENGARAELLVKSLGPFREGNPNDFEILDETGQQLLTAIVQTILTQTKFSASKIPPLDQSPDTANEILNSEKGKEWLSQARKYLEDFNKEINSEATRDLYVNHARFRATLLEYKTSVTPYVTQEIIDRFISMDFKKSLSFYIRDGFICNKRNTRIFNVRPWHKLENFENNCTGPGHRYR